MMATVKSLQIILTSGSSQWWCMVIVFFLIQVDIFLVLGVVSDFESKLDILLVI